MTLNICGCILINLLWFVGEERRHPIGRREGLIDGRYSVACVTKRSHATRDPDTLYNY